MDSGPDLAQGLQFTNNPYSRTAMIATVLF